MLILDLYHSFYLNFRKILLFNAKNVFFCKKSQIFTISIISVFKNTVQNTDFCPSMEVILFFSYLKVKINKNSLSTITMEIYIFLNNYFSLGNLEKNYF